MDERPSQPGLSAAQLDSRFRLDDVRGTTSRARAEEIQRNPHAAAILARELWDRRNLHARRFEDLFVGIASADDPQPPRRVGVRSYNALMRARLDTWESLANARPLDLTTIPNLGVKSFVEILQMVVGAWVDVQLAADPLSHLDRHREESAWATPRSTDIDGPHEVAPLLAGMEAGIGFVLGWLWRERGAVTLADALVLWADADPPPDVTRTAQLLGERPLAHLLHLDPPDERAWRTVLAFSEREDAILRRRVFPDGRTATLAELANDCGVTRERVRQVEKTVRESLEARLSDRPGAALSHAAARLARNIGKVAEGATAEQLADMAVASSSEQPVDDALLRRKALMSWAGPYVELGGLIWSTAGRLVLDAAVDRVNAASPGSVIEPHLLEDLLAELDAPPSLRDPIREHLVLKPFADRLVRWTGSLADKAVGCLVACGQPMTMLELHEAVGFESNPRSLAGQVQSDPRIMRRGKDSYGLRAWGGEEYSGILDELEQAIERAGGSADLTALIDQFVADFGVSAHSVRAYAADRRFIRLADGSIAVRAGGHPDVAYRHRPIEDAAGAYLLDGVWHARFEVDHDTIRGSGTTIRQAIAQAVGLEPDLTLGFVYEGGPVTFSWAGIQPTIGSIRGITTAYSCVAGDLVFLPLDGDEPRACRVAPAVIRHRETGVRRLAVEIGLDADDADDETPLKVATALGLPPGADWHDVADRLRDRREQALESHLPSRWQ